MATIAQRKEIILAQMRQAELYAAYWMNSATNGHATIRTMYHGGIAAGQLFTPDELRDEAMRTAMNHIQRFNDLIDGLHEIHEQELISNLNMNRSV